MQLRATRLTAIASAVKRAIQAFSPAQLFGTGAPGAWYDPSDLTTLFQDSAGTVPVTAVEQPVGLMLDKSQGLVLGSELVVNGDFSNGTTGWTGQANVTLSVENGELKGVTSGNSSTYAFQDEVTIAGKWYKATATLRSSTSNLAFEAYNGAFTTKLAGVSLTAPSTNTTVAIYFLATGSSTRIGFGTTTLSSPLTYFADNISVKELPGNHAFQSTAASRPVLSARVNLLTKTEQFDNAVWNASGFRTLQVTANAITAPDGTLTADKVVEAASAAGSVIQRVIFIENTNTSKTFSIYAKMAERKRIYLFVNGPDRGAWFDLNSGTCGAATDYPGASSVSIGPPDAYGFRRCSITPGSASVSFVQAVVITDAATTFDPRVGDGISGAYLWGADLRPADQATGLIPQYQRVNTSADYDTTGFLPYLKFDGVDDSLSTNSISFTSTDKMSVFAGVRKLSDAAIGVIAELSADISTNNGSFRALAPNGGGVPGYQFGSRGTSLALPTISSGYPSPVTNVYTGVASISTNIALLRLNGTQVASDASSQGTGNFGNYPLFIGRRNNASFPLNGQLYSMIIVGKAVTAGELSSTEKFVASKTGVTL